MKQNRHFFRLLNICSKHFIYLLLIFSATYNLTAQQPTVGLLQYSQTDQQEGYVLFAPMFSTTTYLIDKCGNSVHKWESMYKPGLSVYLLPDGSILRTGNVDNPVFKIGGGGGGIIERIAWDGTLLWSYSISDNKNCQHHDIYPLPNGNVLAIVWEAKNYNDVVRAGRDTAITNQSSWFDKIVEISPTGLNTGDVVWQWSSWDHLVQENDQEKSNYYTVSEEPQRININYTTDNTHKISEWLHFNSLDYNPDLDQILISAYGFGEIWVIDHSTTTEQAASHSGGKYEKGGDLIYRWGNPAAYDMGTRNDRKLFGQHSARWIKNGLKDGGKIMVFNNGVGRRNATYSSVDIITPPVESSGKYYLDKSVGYGPDNQEWIYTDSINGGFSAANYSSAERLPNGNTLVCVGPVGYFFEVTPDNKHVWKYVNPVSILGVAKQGDNVAGNSAFRSEFYPANFPGFAGRDLSSGTPIELEPYPSLCLTTSVASDDEVKTAGVFPNPANQVLQVQYAKSNNEYVEITLINSLGEVVRKQTSASTDGTCTIDVQDVANGMYQIKIFNGLKTTVELVVIAR